jgi:hypothetical protein
MSLKFLLVILTASVIVPGIVTSAKSHASDPSEDAFSTEEMSFLLFKTVNNTFLYDERNASAFTEALSACNELEKRGLVKTRTDHDKKWIKCPATLAGNATIARIKANDAVVEAVPPDVFDAIQKAESNSRSSYNLEIDEFLFLESYSSGSMLIFVGNENPAQKEKVRYVKLLADKGYLSYTLTDIQMNGAPAKRINYKPTENGKFVTLKK